MFKGEDYNYSSGEDENSQDSESFEDITIEKPIREEKGFFARLSSNIRSFTGGKTLTEEDLIPILKTFQEQLISKNVAHEISVKLCDSIKTNLLATKS